MPVYRIRKGNPWKGQFRVGRNGLVAHVSAELFKMMAGVNMVHVADRGAPAASTCSVAMSTSCSIIYRLQSNTSERAVCAR
jgi:hypothetical protein